ncbi:hypothetical protein [Prosthecobacter sp.]|nr:hypothetical protein [Prosthecobacter sp.]
MKAPIANQVFLGYLFFHEECSGYFHHPGAAFSKKDAASIEA